LADIDLSNYKAPYLKFDTIRSRADIFREKHWKGKGCPVDILYIIEFDLHLEIIPIPGLKKAGDIDSFLLGDFSGIAVDEEEYMDDRYLNRIRYSAAHEVGHYTLHREIYDKCQFSDIKTEEEWIDLVKRLPQDEYDWLEQQAYEFAGRLLVPTEDLENEIKQLNVKIDLIKSNYPDIDNQKLAEHIAPVIAKKFDVSATVISKRIMIEKVLDKF
jgi:hypothetical protein